MSDFLFKNSIDLIDGFIARVQKNSSEMGHILDTGWSNIFNWFSSCYWIIFIFCFRKY